MSWNLIFLSTPDEKYAFSSDSPTVRFCKENLDGAIYIATNVDLELADRGFIPGDTVADLLNISLLVYSADTRISRAHSELGDGWTRDFTVHMPVSDIKLWQTASTPLANLLSFLTGDRWSFRFRQKVETKKQKRPDLPIADGACLFSGGLDSFIGAIDILKNKGSLALVGHHGMGTDAKNQKQAHAAIEKDFPGKAIPFWFYVQPKKPEKDGEFENSTRGRSFLFFALGVAIASGTAKHSLFVPENGLISLNAPLTFTRLGSLSTRTTHPHILNSYRRLLNTLKVHVELIAPYQNLTKGEMVDRVIHSSSFVSGHKVTISCAHPKSSRFNKDPKKRKVGMHCGYCLPCIIRRAALCAGGLDSKQDYLYDVRSDSLRRNSKLGLDRRAIEIGLERLSGMSPLQTAAEILKGGPISPQDIPMLRDTFVRGMNEVKRFLAGKCR